MVSKATRNAAAAHSAATRNAGIAPPQRIEVILFPRQQARRGIHLLPCGVRHGLVVETRVSPATGKAEREAAREMVEAQTGGQRRVTLGGDKGYDVREFVGDLRALQVTPHVAQNNRNRRSAIDGRTTRHAGYEVSQKKRKRVEEVFGWLKTVGLLRQTRHRGRERVAWMFTFAAAVYNLVRIRNLTAATA